MENCGLFVCFSFDIKTSRLWIHSCHSTLFCPSHLKTQEMSRITKVEEMRWLPYIFMFFSFYLRILSPLQRHSSLPTLASVTQHETSFPFLHLHEYYGCWGNFANSKAIAYFSILILLIFSWHLTLLSLLLFWVLLIK